MQLETKCKPELEELADKIGTFIEYWGFKKIHGQIWTHIFLSHTPIDATTLAKRLNVSKALVSLALKDLMDYGVILVKGQGDRGKILLVSNTNLQEVIVNVLRRRERKLLSEIHSSFKNIKKMKTDEKTGLSLCGHKMDELGEMIESAEATLDAVINANLEIVSES